MKCGEYMKRTILFIIFILFSLFHSVEAENETLVTTGERYICGDSFEVIFPDEIYVTHMITRQPPRKVPKIHITAGKDDILLAVRLKLRNLTPEVYKGLRTSSFTLTGYVRNQPHSYTAEIWEPYDYGNYDSYFSYSKTYYKHEDLAPLRQIDMLLVFRVNPILRDWELMVEPKTRDESVYTYLDADYEEMKLERCKAVFQFRQLYNAETFEITKYYR